MYDFKYEELKNEFEKFVIKPMKEVTIISLIVSIPLSAFSACIIHNILHSEDKISWESIKTSYVVTTKDNDRINYHFATKSNKSEYYDLINEYNIKQKSIVEVEEATPYFVYNDLIKNKYSKDELNNYIKEFKKQDRYIVSDTNVKVKNFN